VTVEPGCGLDDVPTPALVVDLGRLRANLRRWQEAVSAHGVRFRPHAKTHKTPEIAALQLEHGASGLAVAKVSEAEVFVAAGCRDIVIAYPVVGEEKWRRIAALARDAKITVNADSELGVRGLSDAARAAGVTVHVQVEIDTGLHRCGVAPSELDQAEEFCRLVEALPGVELEGVTTHRGFLFAGRGSMSPAEAGREEGELLVGVAEELRSRGISIFEVTAGGTPTGLAVAAVPGITEVRAGTYVFNDLMQLSLGSAREEDLALTVLATVTSRRAPERATVDGGSKTFSGDRPDDGPLARAVGLDVTLERMSEEHGMVRVGPDADVDVGTRIRFVPYHACPAVNLADELVVADGDRVAAVWRVAARGRRT
jgi:D-serine deaminase-like pyridoxal phosphate-dependent protein